MSLRAHFKRVLILASSIFLLTGCALWKKEIIIDETAFPLINEYKLQFLLEKDDDGKRDLIIRNKGNKAFRGTILLDFDDPGLRALSAVRDGSREWFSIDVQPGDSIKVYMSIYDKYQLDDDVLYLDLHDEPLDYVGRNDAVHWSIWF